MPKVSYMETVPEDLLCLVSDRDYFILCMERGDIHSTSYVDFTCQGCGCVVKKRLSSVYTGSQGVKTLPYCRKCCYKSDSFRFKRIGCKRSLKRVYPDNLLQAIADEQVRRSVENGMFKSTDCVEFHCSVCGCRFRRSLAKGVKYLRGLVCDSCNRQHSDNVRGNVSRSGNRLTFGDFRSEFLDKVYDVSEFKNLCETDGFSVHSKVRFRCACCGNPCLHDIVHYWSSKKGWKKVPLCDSCSKQNSKNKLLETIQNTKCYDPELVSKIPDICPEKPLFSKGLVSSNTVMHLNCSMCSTPIEIKWRYITKSTQFLCRTCQGVAYSVMQRKKFLETYPEALCVLCDAVAFLNATDERKGSETSLDCVCQQCGSLCRRSWLTVKNCLSNGRQVLCDKCLHKSSSFEDEVCAYMDFLGVVYERRKHIFCNDTWFEVDLFLTDHDIALEINGSYWHATLGGTNMISVKPKSYHRDKFERCRELGIRLISIYDMDWETKQNKVKRIIHEAVTEQSRIYARKCTVRECSHREARLFLNTNHFDGEVLNAKFFVALEFCGVVQAVMAFGRPRGVRSLVDGVCEIYRYATLPGVTVVGGMSRCISLAHKVFGFSKLITYSDNNLFSGESYKTLGFSKTDVTEEYFWASLGKSRTFHSRYATQKSKLRKLFSDVTQDDIETKTENEIMIEHGFVKVYTAGNTRWEKQIKEV